MRNPCPERNSSPVRRGGKDGAFAALACATLPTGFRHGSGLNEARGMQGEPEVIKCSFSPSFQMRNKQMLAFSSPRHLGQGQFCLLRYKSTELTPVRRRQRDTVRCEPRKRAACRGHEAVFQLGDKDRTGLSQIIGVTCVHSSGRAPPARPRASRG